MFDSSPKPTVTVSPSGIFVESDGVAFDLTEHCEAWQIEGSARGTVATIVMRATIEGEVAVQQVRIATRAEAAKPGITRETVEGWFTEDGYTSKPTDVVVRHLTALGFIV